MSDAERFGSSKALSHPFASISCYTLWPLTFCILSLPPSHPWPFAGSPPPPPPPPLPPPPLSRKSQCFADTEVAKRTQSPNAQMRLATPTRPNCRNLVATTTETGRSHCEELRLTPIMDVKIFLADDNAAISPRGGVGWGGVGAPGGLLCVWDFLVLPLFSSASQWRSRLQSRYIWN